MSWPLKDQENLGLQYSNSPVAMENDVIGYHSNKKLKSSNSKIFVPFERAWKTDKEKGHNLYLKMHISGDIKETRQNDVINDDVIEK